MDPETSETISCDHLEVYDEDASAFATAEPEVVYAPGLPAVTLQAEDARRAWLKVLERFTEPVPGTKDCLRAPGTPDNRTITLLCRRTPGGAPIRLEGEEVNPTDRACLILFTTEVDTVPRVVSTLIPWADIVHTMFPRQQPDAA